MIEKSKQYTKIGTEVRRKLFPHLKGVRIAFLVSDEEKKLKGHKIVHAECKLVSKQYAWCCHYDFMIVVYEPNVASFSDEQIRILLEHELNHCGIDYDSDDLGYYCVPHDVEEFNSIIEKYGLRWSE